MSGPRMHAPNHGTGGGRANDFKGTAKRLFGYFKALLDGEAGEAYNVSNPESKIAIRDLAEILVKAFPERKIEIAYANHDNVYLENPYKKQSTISVEKLKALGWTPRISLEEGFRRTVASFMEEKK